VPSLSLGTTTSTEKSGTSPSKVPKLNFATLGSKAAPSKSTLTTTAAAATVAANSPSGPVVSFASPKFESELTQREFEKVNWNELEEDPELEITNRKPGDRRYTLTSMELQMKMNAKLQVVLDRHKDDAPVRP